MTRNPRPEPDFMLQTAGSHHPLKTYFLIVRRVSPSCLASRLLQASAALLWEQGMPVEVARTIRAREYNKPTFPWDPQPGSWAHPHHQGPCESCCGQRHTSSSLGWGAGVERQPSALGTHCLQAFLTRILKAFGKEFKKLTFDWSF